MTALKKIIISSYDDLKNPYYHGGGSTCVHELAKGLRNEYDVTVLTSRHKNASQNEETDGMKYQRIGFTPDFFPPLGQLIFLMILPFYLKKLNFDLWIESFTPPFSTAFLPLFTKKTVIGLVHFLSGKEMAKRYKLPFDFIEGLGIPHYKYFIVPNDVTAKVLLAAAPEAAITTIPNGVDLPVTTSTHPRKKMVTFLGRIEIAQKGLDLLMQAIAQIHDDAGWTYVIAGRGVASEEEVLKKLITKLKLEKKVKLIGKVSGAEKTKLLDETSIMAVTSRFETFSMVSLEALAYGLPIVSFDIEGLKWIPEDGVARTPAFDAAELAKNIEKLQQSESRRAKMGKVNKEAAATYGWDEVIPRYRGIIRGLI